MFSASKATSRDFSRPPAAAVRCVPAGIACRTRTKAEELHSSKETRTCVLIKIWKD
jgi:hypothetical protein